MCLFTTHNQNDIKMNIYALLDCACRSLHYDLHGVEFWSPLWSDSSVKNSKDVCCFQVKTGT